MILSVLTLGFLIGMQHAVEPDHLAAVSSVVSRKRGLVNISRHGLFWGLGHTLTLLLVAGSCIAMKTTLDQRAASQLEFIVGIMLIALGMHVLWRALRTHHAAHDAGHNPAEHHSGSHPHSENRIPWRTLFIGTMHGMAGSAALVILAASSLQEPAWGIAYVLLFGLGSIVGMAVLAAVIAVPLSWTSQNLKVGNQAIQLAIGAFTLFIGLGVVGQTAGTTLGLQLNP